VEEEEGGRSEDEENNGQHGGNQIKGEGGERIETRGEEHNLDALMPTFGKQKSFLAMKKRLSMQRLTYDELQGEVNRLQHYVEAQSRAGTFCYYSAHSPS
jgi:hypothetical protein